MREKQANGNLYCRQSRQTDTRDGRVSVSPRIRRSRALNFNFVAPEEEIFSFSPRKKKKHRGERVPDDEAETARRAA